jgi:predicted DNA-binding WGR domain protein
MNKKWALLKGSDIGPMGRGQSGKKKIYEVTVTDTTLHCSWGMAEKTNRQSSTQVFRTSQQALAAGYAKVNSKMVRGYAVAYSV